MHLWERVWRSRCSDKCRWSFWWLKHLWRAMGTSKALTRHNFLSVIITHLLILMSYILKNFRTPSVHFGLCRSWKNMRIFFAKSLACLSVLRNSVWIAVLMILTSLIDPQDLYAVVYRVALKSMEFYIIWSTYGAFKLFKSFKKVRSWEQNLLGIFFKSSTFEFCRKILRISPTFSTTASYREQRI